MSKSDTLMSAGEVALLLRKNPRTIARWATEGRLGPIEMTDGGHRRFQREFIADHLFALGQSAEDEAS